MVWLVGLCLTTTMVGAVLWVGLWSPPEGTVLNGEVVLLGEAPRRAFDSTGLFVLIGVVAGAISGLLAGLLARGHELLTLLTVVFAAPVSGWTMRYAGRVIGPPDPSLTASKSPDLTGIALALEAPGVVPMLAFPVGALGGLFVALVLSPTRTPVHPTMSNETGTMPR